MIGVAVAGACGRMGKLIIGQISKQRDMKIVAAIDADDAPQLGKDAGEVAGLGKLDIRIAGAGKIIEVLKKSKPDVLVDFTRAEAAVQNVKAASKAGVSVVVGTTGFTEEQKREIEGAVRSGRIKAVISPNMSVGVNVFFKLVGETAERLGKDYKVEIIEVHHVHKKDAPSGTAKKAAQIISKVLGIAEGKIEIKSVREGEVVGEHTVIFSNPWERVEVIHRAKSRETFAVGVVKAIRYLQKGGKPGEIHDMQDALNLK